MPLVILTIRFLCYDIYYIHCEINSSKSFHWIFSTLCRYVTDILKMFLWKYDDEKICVDNFPTTVPSK